MYEHGAGCAGVGKSFLTAAVVDLLKAKGMRVEVTASTGIASVQVKSVVCPATSSCSAQLQSHAQDLVCSSHYPYNMQNIGCLWPHMLQPHAPRVAALWLCDHPPCQQQWYGIWSRPHRLPLNACDSLCTAFLACARQVPGRSMAGAVVAAAMSVAGVGMFLSQSQ